MCIRAGFAIHPRDFRVRGNAYVRWIECKATDGNDCRTDGLRWKHDVAILFVDDGAGAAFREAGRKHRSHTKHARESDDGECATFAARVAPCANDLFSLITDCHAHRARTTITPFMKGCGMQ